jgi:hypothetical protein
MDETWQPLASVRGARIIVTGESAVAVQFAWRLRELGAEVRISAVDALAPGDVRSAADLILLDCLAEAPAALLPALVRSSSVPSPAGDGTHRGGILRPQAAGAGNGKRHEAKW